VLYCGKKNVISCIAAMKVTFYFDVFSPYSLFAWKVLERYKEVWDAEIHLVPVALGAVLRESKNQPPASVPARAKYMRGDLDRNAATFGVPILPVPSNMLTDVSRNAIRCQRLIVACQLDGMDVVTLVDSLAEGIHVNKSFRTKDNSLVAIDDAFLRSCCVNAKVEDYKISTLLETSRTKEVKDIVLSNSRNAVKAGAFGVPTMLIEGGVAPFEEPFTVFGSDRFEQVACCCAKPYAGLNPEQTLSNL